MRLKPRALAVVAAALVAVPAIALGASLDGSKAYDDPAGDSVLAPDITRTVVRNDNAGTLAFSIKIPNRPALRRDMVIVVFLDTDPKRGDKDGSDWVLQATSGLPILFRWNGSDFVTARPQSSVAYGYDNSTAVLLVNRQELGSPKAFRFAEFVGSGASEDIDGNAVYDNVRADSAPDQGFYAYTLATKFSLIAGAIVTSPERPTAGLPFTIGLPVLQSEPSGLVAKGKVGCVATLGGASVAATKVKLVRGVATCSWAIPRGAAGKRFKATVSLVTNGKKASRTYSAAVRG